MSRIVTINSRDLNGEIRKSWNAELIEQHEGLITLMGVFESEIHHPFSGLSDAARSRMNITGSIVGTTYFAFTSRTGFSKLLLQHQYASKIHGEVLDYVDLDIDILVGNDGQYSILDV